MAGTEEKVAVVGGGYMGGGIAQTLAAHGIACALVDAEPDLTRQRVRDLHEQARTFAADGLISEDAAAAIRESLRPAESLEDALDGAWYVAEVVPERVDVKHGVLASISSYVPADVIIGSNTSAIPIGELAKTVTHPERFLGVHWMNPAPFVPCVEVIPSASTDPAVVERTLALLTRIGKAATVVGDAPGFVANRLQYALFREAARIVEDGIAGPAQIDDVVRSSFGFRLPFFGPFAIADIAGLDVYRDGFATMEATYGERIGTPPVLTEMVERGRHGLKNGKGFYDFDDEQAEEVARYRDRAYARLTGLRDDLGDVELREHGAGET
jgi:3-hydroxybutyryl-CoA dehydrogenase